MLAKSFFTVSFMTLLSRLSGFVREILVAKYLGTSSLSEAFFVALKLPNFFRRLFAEGAFNAAFIPSFSQILEKEGKEKAEEFSRNIIGLMLVALSIFTIIFLIFMPAVIFVIAPGFTGKGEIYNLTIELTRITFPYLLLISLATAFAGVLQSNNKFWAGGFMPVYFNLSIIFFLLALPNFFETIAHSIAWGVFASGIIQLIWMGYFMKKNNYSFKPLFKNYFVDNKIIFFLKKFAPGAMGAGIFQINLMVDIIIASFFTGAIAFLNYADRINQLPLSLIGTAMGTALLPELSRRISNGDDISAKQGFNKALMMVILLSMPACLCLIAMPSTIMGTLFERGAFTASDTKASAYALVAFAVGLPAFTMNKVFSASFFALKDTKTPVIGATISLFINIFFNLILAFGFNKIGFMPHVGMALATSISGWFNLVFLYIKLKQKKSSISIDESLISSTIKIFLLSFLVAVICYILSSILGYGFRKLFFIISLVLSIYFGSAIWLKIISLAEVKAFFKKAK
ncbi:MAG: murein biosynthesis integral membrane protein MurJ [Rickettsiales bacterium]|nr:murein biosynthesis integral membrane protein MurJ [Rickettsiales bacterium]